MHMTQVHKEQLHQVENAITGRGGLDIEIFGMEGVPPDVIDQHNQQVTAQHFREEAERQAATGNPARGTSNGSINKRAKKSETIEEIEARAEKFRIDRINGVLPLPVAEIPLEPVSSLILGISEYIANVITKTPPAVLPFTPPVAYPPGQYPPGAFPPPRPGSIPGGAGLPQRPGFGAPPPGVFPPNGAHPGADFNASVDDLIADAQKPAGDAPAEKKGKKEKNIKLVFHDETTSPEEKTALLPRFAQYVRV